jgi:hypothetical protein
LICRFDVEDSTAVRPEGAFGTAAQELVADRDRVKKQNKENQNGRERITGRNCCFFDFAVTL